VAGLKVIVGAFTLGITTIDESVTLPENLLRLVNVIVELTPVPAWTISEAGFADILKLGGAARSTTNGTEV
jgi:hypothetical protein